MHKGLTSNQLKLIAMVTMTIDHIGLVLFPQHLWFRVIGRLAFPIYAFLIAEGCHHTRSMLKYLRSVALMALLCQVVSYLAEQSLYQCILVTFSMSICLIFLLQKAKQTKSFLWWLAFVAAVAAVWFVTETLPQLLSSTDYDVDYGFLGVILPVAVWLMPGKGYRLLAAAAVMVAMALLKWFQWFALGALALLAFYNGQRGKYNMKRLFYWYYPAHLAAIHLISML